MKTWLFNPFKFIAGSRALFIGLAGMLISAIICLMTQQHLDGVIDVHGRHQAPAWLYFAEPVIDWLCFVLPLYIFGLILSGSQIRFIDVAGTGAMARYPVLVIVLLSLLYPPALKNSPKIVETILGHPELMIRLVILAFVSIPFIVWAVALMYNGYAISANLKGPRAIWSFIASLLIAEVASKLIIVFLI